MRVNSSPSSLIGPVASYHVSAQLPLREHPQKPRADVPTRALQEGLLLRQPLGMGGALRGPGSPCSVAAVARQLPRGLSPGIAARQASWVVSLRRSSIPSVNIARESFHFQHQYALFLLLFIK